MVLLTEEKKQHIRELRRKAMKLPLHPGVYIMHDKDGTIIYIGKAKALKNRVSQYFGSEKNHDEKVRRMVSNVEYFEYILTDSEFEALILESSLIKQHQPKYNILLKDDKGYSYIKVTAGDWPRISETKQVLDDGAKYIGPYLSAWTIKDTVEEARKIFRLPSCSRKFPQDFGKGRPCLNYYIKQCSAPCRGNVSREEYQEAVQEALDFIRGGASDSVRALTAKMNEAAENMEFELAARIRDRIAAINKLKERQKVVASRVPEQDVFALVLGGEKVSVQVFRFSGGRLYDRETFILNGDSDPEQIRSEFLTQYYAIRPDPAGRHAGRSRERRRGHRRVAHAQGRAAREAARPAEGRAEAACGDVPHERGRSARAGHGPHHRARDLGARRAAQAAEPAENAGVHRVLRYFQPGGRRKRGGHGRL